MGVRIPCKRCNKQLIPQHGNPDATCTCDDPLIMQHGQVVHARDVLRTAP